MTTRHPTEPRVARHPSQEPEPARSASGGSTGAAPVSSAAVPSGTVCVVRLIDRRTGCTPKRNGQAIAVLTAQPEAAVAALLRGRDRTLWDTRVDPFGPGEMR